MDLVRIYTYCSGDNADDDVLKHLDKMVEGIGNSPYAENLRSNLLEVHSKMRYWVKENITNVLAPLLQIPAPAKYHYRFSLFLDPRCVMELTDASGALPIPSNILSRCFNTSSSALSPEQ